MIRWILRRATDKVVLAAAWVGVGLAAPAAAPVSDQPPAVSAYILTPERIAASVAAVVGLIGAVIGGLALARSAGRIAAGNGRRGAIVALVLGPTGLVIGGLVVATADVVSARATGWLEASWPWWWGSSAWFSAGWLWSARAAALDAGAHGMISAKVVRTYEAKARDGPLGAARTT
jgi:uncharacterized protein DUF6223